MKKPYKSLVEKLNESRNLYQQLTGTSNKTIIRENKQLLNLSKLRENKQLINEADDWVDIDCCSPDYYCICRATVVNGTANNCCTTDCNPVPCTSGFPDDDKITRGGGEKMDKKEMNEQTNPFSGGGSGPNWQAAEAAWSSFQQSTQSNPPNPDATFLSNMAGKGCGFYEKRLNAQVNSFVSNFGGSFGAGTNASNAPNQGQNPAWQSQKYARIMWLADAVYNCNNPNTSSTPQSANASCFYDFLNDSTNDTLLTTPVCYNGNQAVAQGNMEQTKFRWQSIADCSMLDDKIAKMLHLSQTTTGCEQIRKSAKHEYLLELKQNCC
jgi:hypothetical protein